MSFVFKNRTLEFAKWPGERKVEIPIARLYMAKHPDLIEVGAVTPYHGPTTHVIYDPYDPFPCNRTDGADVDYTGKHVLTISTVEHIGVIQYGNSNEQLDKGAAVVDKIMSQAATYLITWPFGFNPTLDDAAHRMIFPGYTFFMKQVGPDKWEETTIDWSCKYGEPYAWGNGVIFITNEKFW